MDGAASKNPLLGSPLLLGIALWNSLVAVCATEHSERFSRVDCAGEHR